MEVSTFPFKGTEARGWPAVSAGRVRVCKRPGRGHDRRQLLPLGARRRALASRVRHARAPPQASSSTWTAAVRHGRGERLSPWTVAKWAMWRNVHRKTCDDE